MLSSCVLVAIKDTELIASIKQRLAGERRTLFLGRWLPSLGPTPGARALLERLRAEGLTLVVATSTLR